MSQADSPSSGKIAKSAALVGKLKGLLGVGKVARGAQPDLQVATCAILLEMAESDQDFDPQERHLIEAMLQKHFGLDEAQVHDLIAQTEKERGRASDLFPFTHAIAEQYTPDQKLLLLVMVWRVIFADGRLDPYEDQLAHRLQRMLSVNHSLLMDAKRLAREQFASSE
jgi:uncharacterized tellurite resistance protein B-like protein